MTKKLYRSKENKMVAGLICGIGEYFDIDPNILRVAWVILTFLGMGSLLIVYIIACFIVPVKPQIGNASAVTDTPKDTK